MTESAARAGIVAVARRLDARGIFGSIDGNISVRLDDGSILITPTSCCKGWLEEEEIVAIAADPGAATDPRASSELPMHLAIYAARPDVRAVVHAHPVEATARAVAGLPLDQPILSEAVLTIGTAPVVEWALPGGDGIARSVGQAAVGHDVMLLRFHGAVAVGDTVEQACFRMETLEHVAMVDRLRRQLGGTEVIPAEDVSRLLERRRATLGR